jgi:Pirin C-terminal cupin domain
VLGGGVYGLLTGPVLAHLISARVESGETACGLPTSGSQGIYRKPDQNEGVFSFVMNTQEEIVEALADYQAGRMGTTPATVLHRPLTTRA